MARILLAEDDVGLQMIIQDYLEQRGHEVFAFPDGRSAAEQAERIQPNLVISDIQMPSVQGPQAYEFIQLLPGTVNTPIIFISGLPPAEVEKAVPKGPNVRFLSKPFDLAVLERLVRELLRAYPPL